MSADNDSLSRILVGSLPISYGTLIFFRREKNSTCDCVDKDERHITSLCTIPRRKVCMGSVIAILVLSNMVDEIVHCILHHFVFEWPLLL